MDRKRWQRIEELYNAAIAVQPEHRSALLRSLCANSVETLREVESLLSANEAAGTFLAGSAIEKEIRRLADDEQPNLAGTDLGHYRIIRSVGAGGMGEVYLAFDTKLSRHVALKLLPTRFTLDPQRLLRFEREAQAASALNHPNIITIYEIGKLDNTHFIAAEFIEGMTLRERLDQGPLETLEATQIVIQVATALEVAHAAGITHRDIKPENIMLRPDGLVKVVDFGLARITDAMRMTAGDVTESGVLLGTPRYMSPEQARAKPLDRRTDIFSLGVVFYEMLSRELPFPGSSSAEVFAALLEKDPKPLDTQTRYPFEAILKKALAKDRELRYPSMKEFREELQTVQQRLASGKAYRLPIYRSIWARGLAGILAISLIFWGLFSLGKPGGPSPGTAIRAVPLTSLPGIKGDVAFSPDGTRFTFVWNGGDPSKRTSLYVRGIASGDPVRLTKSEFAERFPVWSPDGRSIAFLRYLPEGNGVFVIPAAGGQERKLANVGIGLSWSPDGQWLAVVDAEPGKTGISLLSVTTGERRSVTDPKKLGDSLPAISPDGKWIAFVRSFTASAREVFVVSINGGEPRQLTFDERPIAGLAWTKDSREVVLSSNRGAGESLWRVPAHGGTLESIVLSSYPAQFPAVSLRGNMLAYTEDYADMNIWRYDSSRIAGQIPSGFGPPHNITGSTREDHSPHICAAGERVAFVSKRTGSEEIWISDGEGGNVQQLTSFRGPGTGSPRMSPDCRFVVFDTRASGNPDIYIVSTNGGSPKQLTTGASTDILPSWSADGKFVYFTSNRSGSNQIWKVSASGNDPVQITKNGAFEGFESPDGKTLFYTKAPFQAGIFSQTLPAGPERALPELKNVGRLRSWVVMREGIYFATENPGDAQSICVYLFKTKKITPFLKVERRASINHPALAIAPNSRWILYSQTDRQVNDIILLENFR